jgi:hypothetical protein
MYGLGFYGSNPYGQLVTLSAAPPSGYTLTAEGGAFSYSGADASTLLNRRLSANGRAFSYSGGNAALRANRKLSADGASFSYVGGIASLEYTEATKFILLADGAAFSYVGGAADFEYVQNFPDANPEDFTVTASIQPISAYSSRTSPDVAYNVMMQSDFKFNGRLN